MNTAPSIWFSISTNEDDQSIGVYFQAILGTTDYIPGNDAEFPQW